MRSAFAVFLRGFTLPFGAISGRRIIFDGVDGVIEFFDDNGDLALQLGGPGSQADSLLLYSRDADEDNPGFIDAFVTTVGGGRQLALRVESPNFDLVGFRDRARLVLASESADGSERPVAAITCEELRVIPDDGLTPPEQTMQMDAAGTMKAIGRGVVDQQTETTNDGPFSADSVTDLALSNVPVIAGHVYALHFHSNVLIGAGGGVWSIFARVNGTNVGRYASGLTTGASIDHDSTVYWTAPTTQATDDFDVFVDETTDGSQLTLQASATAPRWFTITDLGVPI